MKFETPPPMTWWQKVLLIAATGAILGYAIYWANGCAKALGLGY